MFEDQPLKCIVIDDNIAAIDVLSSYLGINSSTLLVKSFYNPLEALSFLTRNQIDLIFLDVDMPEMNGMDFLSIIESDIKFGRPSVILTTAHGEYALPALESSPYTKGIIQKPFAYDKLLKALDKLKISSEVDLKLYRTTLAEHQDKFFYVKSTTKGKETKYLKLKKGEVIYIQGGANYPTLYTHLQQIIIRSTLSSLQDQLNGYLIRVHKSYLVNTEYINEISMNFLQLESGKQIPISRIYRDNLIETLNLH